MNAAPAAWLRRYRRREEGTVALLAAALAAVLVGFAGLAIDTASLAYGRQRLQAATDAAAMAATMDLSRAGAIASAALQAHDLSDATVTGQTLGVYSDDPALAPAARFAPAPLASANALRLATEREVPLYFMRLFTASPTARLSAAATAYNLPIAGLAITTGTADAAGLSDLMQTIAGAPFSLSPSEAAALDATGISVFRLLNGMAGVPAQSIASTLASSVTLADIADAAAQALAAAIASPNAQQQTALDALNRIASQAQGSRSVPLSTVFSLAAHRARAARDLVSESNDRVSLPAMALLLGYMYAADAGALVTLGAGLSVPGLTGVTAQVVVAPPALIGGTDMGTSVIGPKGTEAASAAVRLRLRIQVTLAGIALNLPLVIDIGAGTAALSAISCGPDLAASTDVAVTAQSGLVHLYVTGDDWTDFATPLVKTPATVGSITLPLLGSLNIDASAEAAILYSPPVPLHFNRTDIAQGTSKRVNGVTSLATGLFDLAADLKASNAAVDVVLQTTLKPLLQPLLVSLDPLIQSLVSTLGLGIGYMDVRATAVRCGIPALAS